MKAPSNHILILSAICLSIVAAVGAFKIGEAKKALNETKTKNAAVYIDTQKTSAESRLLQDALTKISIEQAANGESGPFAPQPDDTMTDTLAKNIFLTYAQKESGAINLSNDEIANNIIGSIDPSSLPKAVFSISDIKIFAPLSSTEVKLYANQAGQIIKNHYVTIAAMKDNDDSLEKMSAHIKQIGQELINVKAPSPLAQDHLTLANGYVILADSFLLIAQEEKRDPLKVLLAIKTAKEATESMGVSFGNVDAYLTQNGILFNNDEAGLIWTREIQGSYSQ